MAITRVWVEDGCIVCGACEDICPDVFEVGDETTEIADGADFDAYEDAIREAAEECPVEVIKFDE